MLFRVEVVVEHVELLARPDRSAAAQEGGVPF